MCSRFGVSTQPRLTVLPHAYRMSVYGRCMILMLFGCVDRAGRSIPDAAEHRADPRPHRLQHVLVDHGDQRNRCTDGKYSIALLSKLLRQVRSV